MKNPITWGLVSTAANARIVRGLEKADSGGLEELVHNAGASSLRDARSYRPGRSFASDGSGRRSAMEPGADPVKHDMETFARETVNALEQHHAAGDFARLAIVAEPKMLGILRKQLPPSLRDLVILERSANLGHLSEEDLRTTLREILRSEGAS